MKIVLKFLLVKWNVGQFQEIIFEIPFDPPGGYMVPYPGIGIKADQGKDQVRQGGNRFINPQAEYFHRGLYVILEHIQM